MTQPSAAIDLIGVGITILGLALLAGSIAAALAVAWRWYTRTPVTDGIAVLIGLASVVLWLNAASALKLALVGDYSLLDPETALFTIAAIIAGAVAADLGRRGGDRLATDFFTFVDAAEVGTEMSQLVRSVGRSITVELPDEIADVEGYDPISEETKAALAGKSLVFPRRLTVAELESRLVNRLRDDYGVGHVDVDVDADGTVHYLGVGTRLAGIGPTIATGSGAVAIRADPANNASPGDLVQVWRADGDGVGSQPVESGSAEADTSPVEPTRVATAELRAAAGDVVTLALDETEARSLDASTRYRLVTLPAEPLADREFASLLSAADETMGAVTIGSDSSLVGTILGALDVTVAAVRTGDGVEPIPPRRRAVAPGDTLYVIGKPDRLRKFEVAAGSADATGAAATPAGQAGG